MATEHIMARTLILLATMAFVGTAKATDEGIQTHVHVLRGKPAERIVPAAPATRANEMSSVMVGAGGHHLWIVDRATGRLFDCESWNGIYVQQRQISCASSPLPIQ